MKNLLFFLFLFVLSTEIRAQPAPQRVDSLTKILKTKEAILKYYPANDTVAALVKLFYKKRRNPIGSIILLPFTAPYYYALVTADMNLSSISIEQNEYNIALAAIVINAGIFYLTYTGIVGLDNQYRYQRSKLIYSIEYFIETKGIAPEIEKVFHRKWKHGEIQSIARPQYLLP